MKQVAAVVVTYNRKALLLENIKSLLAQSAYEQLDIILIDNASTDGTREALEAYIASGQIIYNNTGANLGGAGGFNYGVKVAVEGGYEYVWLMDDDCIPTETALEQLLIAAEGLGTDYGFLCSKVLWKDNSICTMNTPRRTMWKKVHDFQSKLVKVVMASFVSLLIPVRVIKAVGLPIKEFFIWTDDWEYTRRISLKLSCYLVNSSIVIHKSGSNIGANIAEEAHDRLERFQYLYRNDVYLWRREGFSGLLYEVLRLSFHIFRVLTKANDNRRKRLQYIVQGTYKGLNFRPQIEYVSEND